MGAGGGVVGRAVILQSGEPEREQESQATYNPKGDEVCPNSLGPRGSPQGPEWGFRRRGGNGLRGYTEYDPRFLSRNIWSLLLYTRCFFSLPFSLKMRVT